MAQDYSELTERQKRFIDYYIETANATESARRAGYSEKTAKNIGNENLTKLNYFIQEKLKEKANERIASRDEVLNYFTKVLRGEEKGAEIKDKIKCGELLGKVYGAFTEKVEVSQDKPFEVNINIKKKT